MLEEIETPLASYNMFDDDPSDKSAAPAIYKTKTIKIILIIISLALVLGIIILIVVFAD